ncbi:hypothetical protein CRM95_20845 [Burkholderia gladioli]|nr:hypothetical protein CRM95_20845 [Burkholderia gladioli]
MLADPPEQLHRHQRMAAQLEELVVAADPLQVQQVLPDRGDPGLGLVERRLVLARDHRARIGLGQGAAIQLAVGGQREGVEHHEGARHHVLGQRFGQLRAQLGAR